MGRLQELADLCEHEYEELIKIYDYGVGVTDEKILMIAHLLEDVAGELMEFIAEQSAEGTKEGGQ